MPVITVSQLNNYIKRYIDSNTNLTNLYIKGEISNFKRHSSGHLYLTLKDGGSVLKCVMFSSYAYTLKFNPADGMKVVALGRVSVYEAGGAYQLYIEQLIPDGKGELYAAYEQLKAELEKKGYFDTSRKKTLPHMPASVGIVTSAQGAAIKDIISILGRRFPMCDVYIYPALVQGIGASESIVKGIEYFNSKKETDVIIIGRGGGSIEDLWAFNEKNVADAVFFSKIPVISAVGHETDFTISDFVADVRASTPSAAAELVVPDIQQIKSKIISYHNDICNYLKSNIRFKRQIYDNLCKINTLDLIKANINDKRMFLDDLVSSLENEFKYIINEHKNTLASKCAKLEALSPLKVLARGYSVVKKDNTIISSAAGIKKGDNVSITLSDGEMKCTVDEIVN